MLREKFNIIIYGQYKMSLYTYTEIYNGFWFYDFMRQTKSSVKKILRIR